MKTLYPGIPFSPQTELTDAVSAGDTVIPVADVSVFPAAPNYATLGIDEDGETVLYTSKSESALSGCTRGVEGSARPWPRSTVIGRNFTAIDLNSLQNNLIELDAGLDARIAAALDAELAEGSW